MLKNRAGKSIIGAAIAAAVLGSGAWFTSAFADQDDHPVPPANHQRYNDHDRDDQGVRTGDRDTRLRTALNELLEARRALQNADHDSAGWRVKALQECDEAIADTRKAIRHDR